MPAAAPPRACALLLHCEPNGVLDNHIKRNQSFSLTPGINPKATLSFMCACPLETHAQFAGRQQEAETEKVNAKHRVGDTHRQISVLTQ